MKYTWIGGLVGTFDCTGINRKATGGENEGNAPVTDFPYPNNYDSRFYTVVDGSINPRPCAEVTEIKNKEQTKKNALAAEEAQDQILTDLENVEKRTKYGLPPKMGENDIKAHKKILNVLQGDIDNPKDTENYYPPLPPGVTRPKYDSIVILVERVEGWQGNLGWKTTIQSSTEGFEPISMAMAVYSDSECAAFKYTTGAFKQDEDGEWFSVCPPGQEPGEETEHFSLLFGAAKLVCFSLPSGEDSIVVQAFQEN